MPMGTQADQKDEKSRFPIRGSPNVYMITSVRLYSKDSSRAQKAARAPPVCVYVCVCVCVCVYI